MKTILFLLICQIAIGQTVCRDTLSPKMEKEYIEKGYTVIDECGWIRLDGINFKRLSLDSCKNVGGGVLPLYSMFYKATEYPATTPIYKVTIENRIDTLEADWIIVAGADGVLRKERHITILKEYGRISDKFGVYNPNNVKYKRLDGELLDVVLLKLADFEYIMSGN